MKIIDPGHKYILKDNGESSHSNTLTFFKDSKIHGEGYKGTTVQEVLRVCIDRVKFIDENCPDHTLKITDEVLFHLRSALVLFEKRHIDRWVQLGYPVEDNLLVYGGNHVHFIPNKGLFNE